MPEWFELVVPHNIINQYHRNIHSESLTSLTSIIAVLLKIKMITWNILFQPTRQPSVS